MQLLYIQNIWDNLCNITDWLEACVKTPNISSGIIFGELHDPYSNFAIRHDAVNIIISVIQNEINVNPRTFVQKGSSTNASSCSWESVEKLL